MYTFLYTYIHIQYLYCTFHSMHVCIVYEFKAGLINDSKYIDRYLEEKNYM